MKDFCGVFTFWSGDKIELPIEHVGEPSGQAALVVKSDDKGGQLALAESFGKNIKLYQFTKNCLAAQATLQTTKYWRNARLE